MPRLPMFNPKRASLKYSSCAVVRLSPTKHPGIGQRCGEDTTLNFELLVGVVTPRPVRSGSELRPASVFTKFEPFAASTLPRKKSKALNSASRAESSLGDF